MLANRFGLARSFTGDDLRLLEALANNASVALQYDRLEQAVAKLATLQDQLHHQAYHDPLTDLPNRSLFMERSRSALARRRPARRRAVHRRRRLQDRQRLARPREPATSCSSPSASGCATACGPQDVVARLGGDEFAVLLPASRTDQLAAGRLIAERIMRAFDQPVHASERPDLGAPERRHRHERPGGRRRRSADPQRRRRHVPGQVEGQGALRGLRAVDGRRDPAPPRTQGGARQGAWRASRSSSSTSRS